MPSSFVSLHTHSVFSVLDGMCRFDDLVSHLQDLNMSACALTDHGNVHGSLKFHKKCIAAGIKPILGEEFYVADDCRDRTKRQEYHLTILAKNQVGWKNLCWLSSRAFLEGFYYKPRIDHLMLKEHAEGLIVLSGCLGAPIPQKILLREPGAPAELLDFYQETFGEDFYIELQPHLIDDQKFVNERLLRYAVDRGISLVATNDSHYVRKEDQKFHKYLLMINTKTTIGQPGKFVFSVEDLYVKSGEEMKYTFEKQGILGDEQIAEALYNSCRIAEKVGIIQFDRSFKIFKSQEEMIYV